MKKRRVWRRRLLWASVLMLAGFSAMLFYGWNWVHRPYQGYQGTRVVEVPAGFSSAEIIGLLDDSGILEHRYPAMLYLYLSAYRGRLQAGEYLFDAPMSPDQIFAKLAHGEIRLYTFTVPEGLRVDQIAERWEDAGFGDRSEFLEAVREAMPAIREVDPLAVSAEGYLFPETYSFPREVSARDAVGAMVQGFRNTIARLEQVVGPDEWPLDLNGTVILASLIESEASVDDERSVVSSVFLNRLERRMRLECDPTVIYALIQDGSYRGRLLRADLGFDSPYNTYLYPDLPPGPINNPGYLSLLAAVQPAETEYIFFVRTDGGRHTFSRTLAEHNRAVAAYRRGVN